MNPDTLSLALKIISILIWPASIILVLVLAGRFQREVVDNEENKIKLKDKEIEKKVDDMSLEQLVDLNNKDRKS